MTIPLMFSPELPGYAAKMGEWITAIDIMGYAHEYDGLTMYSRKLF